MRHQWNEFVAESAGKGADGSFTSTADKQRARALAAEMNDLAVRSRRRGADVLASQVATPNPTLDSAPVLIDNVDLAIADARSGEKAA